MYRSIRSLAIAAVVVLLGCSPGEREPESPAVAETATSAEPASATGWTDAELGLLRSLSLRSLPDAPPSQSNHFATNEDAARLGHRLFFEPRLSRNGEISCAICHLPDLAFTDGLARSRGLGETGRNAPTLIGLAHGSWFFWDGRRDSLWAQALTPMEAAPEMGATRLSVVRFVTTHPDYAEAYRELFGDPPDFGVVGAGDVGLPQSAGPHGDVDEKAAWEKLSPELRVAVNRAFSNVGKALEAYERLLLPGPSRFDRYVDQLIDGGSEPAEPILSEDEIAGLRLFADAGRTQCLRCHNGPLMTNHSFHDIASSRFGPIQDFGRFLGVQSLLLDEFNCLGAYSDAPPDGCQELRFLNERASGEKAGAFKTPTLRSVGETAPYFHDGSLESLEQVIEHYRNPPAEPGHELPTLLLSDTEAAQLTAFLRALSGGVAADPTWLAPPSS